MTTTLEKHLKTIKPIKNMTIDLRIFDHRELVQMLNSEFQGGLVKECFDEEGILRANNSDKIFQVKGKEDGDLHYFLIKSGTGFLDYVTHIIGGIENFFIFERQWDANETYGVLLVRM